jgi:hypothetical protein
MAGMERRFRVQSKTRKERCSKLIYILFVALFLSNVSAAQDKLIITPIAEDLYVYTTYNMYGGCLVKSTEAKDLGNIADANLAEWPKTIRKLIKRYPNPTYVVPGHFGWDSKALQHTLKLLE